MTDFDSPEMQRELEANQEKLNQLQALKLIPPPYIFTPDVENHAASEDIYRLYGYRQA